MAFNEYFIGKRERLSWVAETSYGTGGDMSTNGEVIGANATIEPDFSQSFQEVLTAGADNLKVQNRVKGPKNLPFTLNFSPVNWVWLKYLMSVADADDAGTKTHTFTISNTVQSFNLEWARRATTASVITLTGGFVKSATLSWTKPTGEGTEGLLNVSLNCVGRDASEGSTVTSLAANITKDPFQFRQVVLTLDGNEITEVNNGELTIDLGIDENQSRYANATEDRLLSEPIPKVFRVSGRVNINVKDNTYWALWDAATTVAGTTSLKFDRDGTGNDQMLFTMENVRVDPSNEPTNLEGVINVDLNFTADAFSSVVARDDITTY